MKLKKIYILAILTLIFSMIKIDYRFQEIPYGLEVDDAEYYYSAVTIGLDFDLDFSNQMEGVENRYLNKEVNKVVPFHPIGSGILASPFVFLASIFDKISNSNGLVSSVYFAYSISPIFYLFLSIILVQYSMNSLGIRHNKYLLLIGVFGTGVSYYAFDRFSMSHIYEVFASAFLIYLTCKSLEQKNSSKFIYINFFLGFAIFFFLTIRWINYFFFLIPVIIYKISNSSIKNVYMKIPFISGALLGLVMFLLHTKYLYGIYTLNQAPILLSIENSFSENYTRFFNLDMFVENIIFIFNGLQIIFFSQEFGLFFFAPILFMSFLFVVFSIINKEYLLSLILLIMYSLPLLSVIVTQNTAFSYGFRYLFALIPINIILYFKYLDSYKPFKRYLYLFSFIGLILYLFFETTQATSLSNDYIINSFGMNTRYANPYYLSNFSEALLNLNAYMHILFTSFLGVLIIKCLAIFTDPISFFSNFTEISPEISNLVIDSVKFSWFKLAFLYFLVIYMFSLIIRDKSKR